MALSPQHPAYLHVLRDCSLAALSLCLAPLSLFVVSVAYVLSWLLPAAFARPRAVQSKGPRAKVLVTGVGMEKGLFLARALYLGGCDVIGADFETGGIPACGRYSRAVRRFYRLSSPLGEASVAAYIDNVIRIIREEDIDIWISCSGVATALEDARLLDIVEQKTRCRAFQFDDQATFKLDNKLAFMQQTQQLGLRGPRWYPLRSSHEIDQALSQVRGRKSSGRPDRYIVKNVSMDDKTRGSLPLLSSADMSSMAATLRSLSLADDAGWILQEYVEGEEEYCTHAVIINGRIAVFLACRSASILMHYEALNPQDPLAKAMQHYTEQYAQGMYREHGRFTGHLSFDFLVQTRLEEAGVHKTIMPIECNPRCHTATVLLRGREVALTNAYLSVLPGSQSRTKVLLPDVTPGPRSFYWLAHDLVALLAQPLIDLMLFTTTWREFASSALDFGTHILLWRDATFEWWDPVPFLVLNHVHWPLRFVATSWNGIRWKQVNVSTTKMFLA